MPRGLCWPVDGIGGLSLGKGWAGRCSLFAASAWLTDQLVWDLQVVLSETVQDALFVMEPLSQHELLQMGRGRYR